MHGTFGHNPQPAQRINRGTDGDIGDAGKIPRKFFIPYKAPVLFVKPENLPAHVEIDLAIDGKNLGPTFGNSIVPPK